MRRTVVVLALIAPIVLASGSVEAKRSAPVERFSSARFFQVTTIPADENGVIPTFHIVEGAFDWRDQTGWAIQRYANESILWRQVDGVCLETDAGPPAMKIEEGCGLPALANDPRRTLGLMRQRYAMENIGTEEIDGIGTTHFTARRAQREGGPVDLWVDENDVVRKLRFGPTRYPLVIHYMDFGVDAGAKWASPLDPPRWTPDKSWEAK